MWLFIEVTNPDKNRFNAFVRGWNDASIRNIFYSEKTLEHHLSWQNLGNRLGQFLGDVPDDFKLQCFNYAILRYNQLK